MTDKSLYGMFKYEHSIHPKKHPSYGLACPLPVAYGSEISKLWVFRGGRGTKAASCLEAGGFAFAHEAAPSGKEEVMTTMRISEQLWFSQTAWGKNAQFTILDMIQNEMELEGG